MPLVAQPIMKPPEPPVYITEHNKKHGLRDATVRVGSK